MFCERGGIEKYVICSLEDRFVFQLSNDKFSDELFFPPIWTNVDVSPANDISTMSNMISSPRTEEDRW